MAGTFLVAYHQDDVLMGVICSWFCFCVCKKRECSSSACPTLEFSFPSLWQLTSWFPYCVIQLYIQLWCSQCWANNGKNWLQYCVYNSPINSDGTQFNCGACVQLLAVKWLSFFIVVGWQLPQTQQNFLKDSKLCLHCSIHRKCVLFKAFSDASNIVARKKCQTFFLCIK